MEVGFRTVHAITCVGFTVLAHNHFMRHRLRCEHRQQDVQVRKSVVDGDNEGDHLVVEHQAIRGCRNTQSGFRYLRAEVIIRVAIAAHVKLAAKTADPGERLRRDHVASLSGPVQSLTPHAVLGSIHIGATGLYPDHYVFAEDKWGARFVGIEEQAQAESWRQVRIVAWEGEPPPAGIALGDGIFGGPVAIADLDLRAGVEVAELPLERRLTVHVLDSPLVPGDDSWVSRIVRRHAIEILMEL